MLIDTDHLLDPDPWESHLAAVAGRSQVPGSTDSVSQALIQISQALSLIASEMAQAA